MNVLDLFSGIGGFSLGLEKAGMHTVAFCEIEPYACAVLNKNWPGIKIYGDVRNLTAQQLQSDNIDRPDVICGGFPCQDISLAGKGAGLSGARSGLWFEFHRLIDEIRPAWVIAENVAALRSRGLDEVLGSLAAIGYDAEWHCIPASAVGAPHRRDRVWIVAYPGCQRGNALRTEPESDQPGAPVYDQRCGTDVAYPARLQSGRQEQRAIGERAWQSGEPQPVPNANSDDGRAGRPRRSDPGGAGQPESVWPFCDAHKPRLAFGQSIGNDARPEQQAAFGTDWWLVEPDVGRVAHGIPARVDRLRSLGNAVVPQIPEIIGRAIFESRNHA